MSGHTTDSRPRNYLVTVGLIVILALAFFLRVYRIADVPAGLQIDEASIALNAYLVGETGRDETGRVWPLYPRSSWNAKHPVYFYVSVAAVKLLGLNSTSARLPAALFGVLGVLAAFLLARELTGNAHTALLAALFMALSPWHTHLSRFGVEAVSLPAVVGLGLWLLVRGVKGRPWLMVPGAAATGLSFYSYPVALLFTPLLLVGFAILYRRELMKTAAPAVVAALLLAAMFLPVAAGVFRTAGMDDYMRERSITSPAFHKQASARLEQKGGPVFSWIARTPAARTAYGFITNYGRYMSWSFLFSRGDPDPRHGTGRCGVMYAVCFLFLLPGLGVLLAEHRPEHLLLLWWFVLFPAGAALMDWGRPHAIRSATALPCLQMIAALGFVFVCKFAAHATRDRIRPATAAGVLIIILAVSAGSHFHYYFTGWAEKSAPHFNYGFDRAVHFMEQSKKQYKTRLVTWTIPYVYTYFMFYAPPNKEQIVWRKDTGAMDIDATLHNMGYTLCDFATCLEQAPKPAMALGRPGQLPPGVYKKRAGNGFFMVKTLEEIRPDHGEPLLIISEITDTKPENKNENTF